MSTALTESFREAMDQLGQIEEADVATSPEYEVFPEVYANGDVVVTLTADGTAIAEMNIDVWRALNNNVESST